MPDKIDNTNTERYNPKYISQNLTKEEKILVSEQTCGWLYKPLCYTMFFVTILCLIAVMGSSNSEDTSSMFITALIFGGYSIWSWFSNRAIEMAVTNKRIILKKGIFIHQTNELRLEKVESVNIHKSFWGLIFGYATLIFTGTGNKVIKFDGIANPQKVKNEIDEVFETYAK